MGSRIALQGNMIGTLEDGVWEFYWDRAQAVAGEILLAHLTKEDIAKKYY